MARKSLVTSKDIILESQDGYGVNNLVNFGLCFQPIEDADKLLEECNSFVEERDADLYQVPFASFSRVAAGVRNWRAKQRESKLSVTYNSLVPRILEQEKALRQIIGEVVEKKKSLRLQARYLQVRLNTCLEVNKNLLLETDGPLQEIRSHVDNLSEEAVRLKEMSIFNREILRLKLLSTNRRNKPFMGWGNNSKQKPKTQVTESDLAEDTDHTMIGLRLECLRQLKDKYVKFLAEVLEKRVKEQMNIESCKVSLQAIKTVVTREGWSSVADMAPLTIDTLEGTTGTTIKHTEAGSSSSGDGSEYARVNNPNLDKVPYTFDHSRCRDCSYSRAITSDCTNHMATLQRQAAEANSRLMELVMMRERMSSDLAFTDSTTSSTTVIEAGAGGSGYISKDRESMADSDDMRESMSFNSRASMSANMSAIKADVPPVPPKWR